MDWIGFLESGVDIHMSFIKLIHHNHDVQTHVAIATARPLKQVLGTFPNVGIYYQSQVPYTLENISHLHVDPLLVIKSQSATVS